MEKQTVLFIRGECAGSPRASGIEVEDDEVTGRPPIWLALVLLLSVLFWAGVVWAVL